MQFKKHPGRTIQHLASSPFIYAMIFPLIFVYFCLEIYHQICFRLYSLPLVKRSKYIRIDRHKLEYLTLMEKINCAYCGYANGLLAYASKIAADTEQYWCGIKHKKDVYRELVEPEHHKNFIEYGDEEGYKNVQ